MGGRTQRRRTAVATVIGLLVVAVSACSSGGSVTVIGSSAAASATPTTSQPSTARSATGRASTAQPSTPQPSTAQPSTQVSRTLSAQSPPSWLGTRPLPLRPDGYGEIQPTPAELRDRRFTLPDTLPAPASGGFEASVEPVPTEVLARSTWTADCPVTAAQLRYLRVSFWGFDDRAHTGELLVNARVAEQLVTVFHTLFDARFPIEEMRIASQADLSAAPTGDGNDTGAFACRASRGSSRFSEHAYGLAVDLNPFQNPYHKGDVVLPNWPRLTWIATAGGRA